MASAGLVIRIRISGVDEVITAFRRMPKAANKALRDRTKELSQVMAAHAKAAARGDSAQSALMAPTVRARRDRLPVVVAGGSKRVGRNRKPAYKILFGSEFGATYLAQYRPHVGAGSYWFFDTFDKRQHEIERKWLQIADDVVLAWAGR